MGSNVVMGFRYALNGMSTIRAAYSKTVSCVAQKAEAALLLGLLSEHMVGVRVGIDGLPVCADFFDMTVSLPL